VPAHEDPATVFDSLGRAALVAKWVFLRGVRQPAIGLLAVLLIGLVPLQARLSPLADIGVDPAWALADAWTLPVGLVGMALALALLGRSGAFLELLPWGSRWLGEALALLVGALGLQIPLWIGAACISAAGPVHQGPGAASMYWLLADLQAAGIGLLLLRGKGRPGMRVAWFGGILWLLPAMLPADRLANGLAVIADLGPGVTSPTPEVWISRGAITVALVLASALLAAPRNTSAPRASRNPR